QERPDGMYVTDVWDDIRELTSGYFAGDEALREQDGSRVHKQQSPRELLLRILLSSTKSGDTVLDPFGGTGTTLVVAEQLSRAGVGIELSEKNVAIIKARTEMIRKADDIHKLLDNYKHTANLDSICGVACGVMNGGLANVKTVQSSVFNFTVNE
ncbi:MAG: site-specific DNA-methyltransferase, partial [Pyrinomonadaceae bacterium MAG19_C2-C3]|nr:site-specific DNA-methyltransferase [Pyrinomonadaceae bacterium MAG19_C2-C3]